MTKILMGGGESDIRVLLLDIPGDSGYNVYEAGTRAAMQCPLAHGGNPTAFPFLVN